MGFLDTLKERVSEVVTSLQTGALDSVAGIDIGSSAIKVVQLKRSAGTAVLETYGSVSLAPYAKGAAGDVVPMTEELIVTAINDLLRDARITTKNVIVSIPASASLLFSVKIPPVPESEYAPVITNEARKYIPVPLAEVSLDWWVLPANDLQSADATNTTNDQRTFLNVLVAAIQTQIMSGYESIVKKANLQARAYEIELFSQVRSLIHHELGTVMIIDIGALATRVGIVHEGVIRKTHIIHRGSQYISSAIRQSLGVSFEEAEALKKKNGMLAQAGNERATQALKVIETSVAYITAELTGFLSQYERESHETVEKIILAGGGSEMSGLIEHLQTAFPVTVTKANPFSKTEYPEFLDTMLRTIGPEFSVATGLALRMVQ